MNRKIIIPVVLLSGALAVGSLGLTHAYAQDSAGYSPIVQKIAEKFGLNVSEVQDVFDEARADHHAQMLTNFEGRLTQAVTDGKITEEQKQKILDKHEEMQAKMYEWKNLTPEGRREKIKAFHEELKTWAEENEIDFPFLIFRGLKPGFSTIGGSAFGGGHGGMMFEHRLD